MATKTVNGVTVEKHEIEKMARMAINALSTSLSRNVFTVETDGYSVSLEITDIKAFISRRQLIILCGYIDIHYSNGKSVIKIYDYEKDDYMDIEAEYLSRELESLLELARQKVKERLEITLREI
jgi:hypothetical protein